MRTSGSQLLVLGEFRRSLFDGTEESRFPLLCFLEVGTTSPAFLAEPAMGPKRRKYIKYITHKCKMKIDIEHY